MSKQNTYKIDQVDTYKTAEFDKILSECAKIKMPKEYLLSLYNRVLSNMKDDAEHISPFDGSKTNTLAIQFPGFSEILSKIMDDLGKFNPLEFMKNYTAAQFGTHNCTAVENCFVFEKFLKMARKAERLIIVDATPYLVEKIAELRDESIRSRIVLTFTNSLVSKIYRKCFLNREIQVMPVEKYNFPGESVVVLYYGHYYSSSDPDSKEATKDESGNIKEARENFLCRKLTAMNDALSSAQQRQFLVLLPTSMIDPEREHAGIRRDLLEHFTVQTIDIIDNRAIVTNGYKRLSLVKLCQKNKSRRNGSLQSVDVVLRKYQFIKEKMTAAGSELTSVDSSQSKKSRDKIKNQPVHGQLQGCEEYRISATILNDNLSTIRSIYSAAAKKEHIPQKRVARKYEVSPEISFGCSGQIQESGKIKPRIIYQGYVAREDGQDYLSEKHLLHYEDRNKTYVSLDEMHNHIEQLVLSDPGLNAMIAKSIKTQFKYKPISIKSFCVMHYDVLRKRKLYEDIYNKVFASPHSTKNPICKLVLNGSTYEEVAEAVEKTVADLGLNEAEENMLILQLFSIYRLAVDRGYADANPVQNAAKVILNQDKQEKNLKNRMVEKILTDEQERDIFSYLLSEEPDPGLALGLLIKYTTGMSYSEVCALTRGDLYKLSHVDCMVFNVDKRFEDKHTTAIPHLNPLKIRQIPISSFLSPMISEWSEFNSEEIDESTDKDETEAKEILDTEVSDNESEQAKLLRLPIVYRKHEPLKPITPDVLRRFGNDIFERFGPASDTMRMANEKGGKKDIHTTEYSGDKFRENFYDQGLSVAGLTQGELCYLLGYHAPETYDSNYAGFDKPSILVKMREQIDVWISKRLRMLDDIDESSKAFRFGERKRRFVSAPTNIPMEIIMEIKIEETTPDFIVELENRLGFHVVIQYKEKKYE